MNKLDTIRVRHAASQCILGAGDRQIRDDVGYLLNLLDILEATVNDWKNTANRSTLYPSQRHVLIKCIDDVTRVLNG